MSGIAHVPWVSIVKPVSALVTTLEEMVKLIAPFEIANGGSGPRVSTTWTVTSIGAASEHAKASRAKKIPVRVVPDGIVTLNDAEGLTTPPSAMGGPGTQSTPAIGRNVPGVAETRGTHCAVGAFVSAVGWRTAFVGARVGGRVSL